MNSPAGQDRLEMMYEKSGRPERGSLQEAMMLWFVGFRRNRQMRALALLLYRLGGPLTPTQEKKMQGSLLEIFGVTELGHAQEMEVRGRELRERLLQEWTSQPAFPVERLESMGELLDKEQRRRSRAGGLPSVQEKFRGLGLGPGSKMGVA